MRDVLFVLLTVGFFALCAAFVAACSRIVGPDEGGASRGEQPDEVRTGVTR